MMMPYSILLLYALVLFNLDFGRSQQHLTELAVHEGFQYDPNKTWSGYNSLWDQGPIMAHATTYLSLVYKSHIFIDKSLLLKDLLAQGNTHLLITCPRRWGKSVNLDMLKTFVEIEVDKNGRPIESESERPNYQLFKYGKLTNGNKLRKPPLISQADDLFAQYQGKYPVIKVRFYFYNITNSTVYEDALRDIMCRLYKKHKYMLNALECIMNSTDVQYERKLEAEERYNKFKKYIDRKAPLGDLVYGVQYLTEVLHKHFNKGVFVLIDDYDDLVNDLLLKNAFNDRNAIRQLHIDLYRQSVTDNEHAERVVVTGLMSVAKYLSQGALRSLVVYNFLNSPIPHFYGYTEREVNLIYDFLNVPAKNRTIMDEWFRGYRASLITPIIIYDPRSVNQYLERKRLTYAWETKLGTLETVMTHFMAIQGFEETWNVLITGGNYTIQIDSLDDAGKLSAFHGEYQNKSAPQAVDIVLHYLLIQGYLTWVDCQYPSPTKTTPLTVRVPNNEMLMRLKTLTFVYYSSKRLKVDGPTLIREVGELDELFIEFIESNNTRGYLYELTLQEYLKLLPAFELDPYDVTTHKPSTTYIPGTKKNKTFTTPAEPFSEVAPSAKVQMANRDLVRSGLFCAYMYNHSFRVYSTGNDDDIRKPDILLRRGRRGVIIKIVYIGRMSPFLMDDVKPFVLTSYADKFNNHVDSVKFIVMLVQDRKRVTAKAWDEDIKK